MMGELEVNRVRVHLTETENDFLDDEMIERAIMMASTVNRTDPEYITRIIRVALRRLRGE